MRENPSGHQGGFESMEHDNERQPMVSHQSETTPKTVAEDWQAGVYEMKHEAMDEAYGLAGKRGNAKDFGMAHSQFREYPWA
ncbi:MAG: hypothetical protein LLF94_05665 [Chlamydiales bacterium]|nr:hypothetical protein [Chlamydiales bacterium]